MRDKSKPGSGDSWTDAETWTDADKKLYADLVHGRNGERKMFSQAAIREVDRRRRER